MTQRYTETTRRSISWLRRTNEDGRLEMTPPYQRGPVWSEQQKSALIETVLLEYPIPEIYMQDVVTEDGGERHIVVDGQQRIRAVLEFISDEFAISHTGSRWEGLSFSELRGEDRIKIYEYSFVTRLLPTIPEEQIRAIFQRINRNTVSLNSQELRHATYWGEFIKLMESLSDLEFWSNINIFSANDRRRMLDTEFVSELTVAYLNGLQNKKGKLEDFYQMYEVDFDKTENVRSCFFSVLGEIEGALPEIRKTRFRKKSDFYTLFLVLAAVKKLFPLTEERRKSLGDTLREFGDNVDKYLNNNEAISDDNVAEYARYVERAASDLGSRRARARALGDVLKNVLPELHAPAHEMLAEPPVEMQQPTVSNHQT
ncbi:DUF262 domain-containing protein [Methylobacterium sp. EM32]|uniref:DUF262 domain-containing protein n=1 Tax=Methylobacterium sp. EM32 TaxID=3163481 RepID=UPI0033A86B71